MTTTSHSEETMNLKKPNQSEFIRKYPDMPTRELVELGAKAGVIFSMERVHHVRNMTKKKTFAKTKKPGIKVSAHSPTIDVPRKPGRPPGSKNKITNDVTRKPNVMDKLLEAIIEAVTAKVLEKLRSAL
jgi:hypothetical protein